MSSLLIQARFYVRFSLMFAVLALRDCGLRVKRFATWDPTICTDVRLRQLLSSDGIDLRPVCSMEIMHEKLYVCGIPLTVETQRTSQ